MPPKYEKLKDTGSSSKSERSALLDGESSDDDFFLSGPRVDMSSVRQNNDKMSRIKGQVDEVAVVMKDNIARVMERGDRLDDLQDRSEDLTSSADMFNSRSRALRRNMWWKECRMRLIISVVVVIVLLIIIVPIVISLKKKKS